MKYKLIKGSCNNLQHAVGTALLNRGIENVTRYLNANEHDCESYLQLDNISAAYEIFIRHIQEGDYIEILVDSDCDGYTSAAILYDYIVKNFEYEDKIGYILHEGKEHGLSDEKITINPRTKLLIIPDASSNEEGLHEKYVNQHGIDIIVLDHHQCDKGYSRYATVVNNQLSTNYTNKDLSGVGIVYKFLQKCDNDFDDWLYTQVTTANDYLDMVAVGMLGDVMKMDTLENRHILNKGLKLNLSNMFLKTLMDKESFTLGYELTPIKVSFNVVPLVNAMIRVGDMEDKDCLFRAMCNIQETFPYHSRTKGDITETLQEKALRLCKSAKGKQSRIRDKALLAISARIENENLDSHAIIAVNVEGIVDSTLTGVVAIKVSDMYNKPILLYRSVTNRKVLTTTDEFLNEMFPEEEDTSVCLGGSARNKETSGVDDFRKYCLSTELFTFCEGHGEAFGFQIKEENLPKFLELADEQLKDIMQEYVSYVDFDYEFEHIPPSCYADIYHARKIWTANGIQEPKVHISNIKCNTENITISDKGYMRIVIDDVELVQLNVKEGHVIYDLLDELFGEDKDIELEVIGTIGINDFKGKLTKQIRIEQLEIIES